VRFEGKPQGVALDIITLVLSLVGLSAAIWVAARFIRDPNTFKRAPKK
jgi:hypothetical protein